MNAPLVVGDAQWFSPPYPTRGIAVEPIIGSRLGASSSVGTALCRCDAHKVVSQPFIGSDLRGATTPPLLPQQLALSVVWGLSITGAGNMQRCS